MVRKKGEDEVRYERGTAPVNRTGPLGDNTSNAWKGRIKPRAVVVARDPRPSVERMIEDTQFGLAQQFAQFRVMAQSELFDEKRASALAKLVNVLVNLDALEEKRVARMRLASYSEHELAQLEPEARKLLQESKANTRD